MRAPSPGRRLEDGTMRGRSAAAIWLFALLGIGLVVVGASAPRARESRRVKVTRAKLVRLAAERASVRDDESIRPENGCLRDRDTEVFNSPASMPSQELVGLAPLSAPAHPVTASVETSDPSARDQAYYQLIADLRGQWAKDRIDRLESTPITFVALDNRPRFSWDRWQSLLVPGLSTAADSLGRTTLEVCDVAWRCYESWLAALSVDEGTEAATEPVGMEPHDEEQSGELPERRDGSVLLRRSPRATEEIEIAERHEQSVLVR